MIGHKPHGYQISHFLNEIPRLIGVNTPGKQGVDQHLFICPIGGKVFDEPDNPMICHRMDNGFDGL